MKAEITDCTNGIYFHLIGTIQEVCYFNKAKLRLANDSSKNLMLIDKQDVIILEDYE